MASRSRKTGKFETERFPMVAQPKPPDSASESVASTRNAGHGYPLRIVSLGWPLLFTNYRRDADSGQVFGKLVVGSGAGSKCEPAAAAASRTASVACCNTRPATRALFKARVVAAESPDFTAA